MLQSFKKFYSFILYLISYILYLISYILHIIIMEKIKAKILEINKQTADISEFIIKLEKEINFHPWQFIMMDIENWDEKMKKNAYSVTSYDKNSWILVLLIKFTWWIWTSWLWERKIWDDLSVYWWLGHFSVKWNKDNLIFFATWIWLPPLVCMLDDLFKNPSANFWKRKNVKLFFWTRKKEDIYYQDFLENLKEKNPNFSYEICLSREEWYWFHWYIIHHPDLENIDFENSEVYYCWSVPVVKDLKEKLFSLGLNKKSFFSEAF